MLREFDRICPDVGSRKISEGWESLIPTIFELAKNENCGALATLIDGSDNFSDGKYAYMSY